MMVMALILVAAAAGLGVAQWLRLPSIPFLVLMGVGLSLTGVLETHAALVENALILGLTFLLFVMGTDLNPERVGGQRRAATLVGAGQFFLLGGVAMGFALLVGFEPITAVYIALAMAASSTLVVVSLLRQRQQFFEPFGRLVLGVLLLQDVLVIALLSVVSELDAGTWGMVRAGAGTLLLLVMAWVCLQWVAPYLIIRLKLDEESLLLTVLAILFLFVGVSHQLDLPLEAGAFFAGVALSGFPVNGLVRGQLTSLADFFSAVFFVALGTMLTLPTLAELQLQVLLVALLVLATPPLVLLLARAAGVTVRSGLESGLLLAQSSEFSIIVAYLGMERGHLDAGLLGTIALVTIVTMILTPFIATDDMTWRLMRYWPGRRVGRPDAARTAGHVLMLGCGRNGVKLLNYLLQHGQRVVVIDDDPGIVRGLKERGVEAYRGDGADEQTLRQAGADGARAIVSNMRRLQDNTRMLRLVPKLPVLVRVFGPDEAGHIRAYGGIPVVDSEAAAEGFIRWFERWRG